jgi:hypothetical protein
MKRIITLMGLGLLIAVTAGCEIEERHHYRGGYYSGYYGEYPYRSYGHESYRPYRTYPYDRDHYWYRDRD